ncbi:MAG: DUF3299 domain-containing protein [Bacteroidota bacterium]
MNITIKMLALTMLTLTALVSTPVYQDLGFGPFPLQQNTASKVVNAIPTSQHVSEPQVVDWSVLINIDYELKYYKEVEMELYAPVFTEAVKALDGKEVRIKGYIIPIDDKGELLALSANPYASCFFCGQASPASVISVYLKNKGERYKLDELKEFRGVLNLNYDDPDQFYYVLKDAY